MQPDPPDSPPEDVAPPRPIALDYHLPTAPTLVNFSRNLGKPLGLGAILIGAVLFPLPLNSMQPFGLAVAGAGLGWWVWCHRAGMSAVLRTQFLVAAILCALGFYGVATEMQGSGPTRYSYWFTENQTYGMRRSRVLGQAWPSAVGILWMLLIATIHYGHVLARRARCRNNRPPSAEQE